MTPTVWVRSVITSPPPNWNWANQKRPCSIFLLSRTPSLLDLHKLAICHEQLGHREQALTAVQQAELLSSGEIERQMLALVRYRLEHPGYLHDSTYGTQLLDCFQHLRDTYPMGFIRFHLPWVLAWYKANRQYRQACRLLEEFPAK